MDNFIGFEDEALAGRVRRLNRASYDLQERMIIRKAQAAIGQRWLMRDPLYQRLSLILRNVREELQAADQELTRRKRGSGASRSGFTQAARPET